MCAYRLYLLMNLTLHLSSNIPGHVSLFKVLYIKMDLDTLRCLSNLFLCNN